MGTAAVRRGVEHAVDGVQRQPVDRHRRQTVRSRDPRRAIRRQHVHSKVGRDEEIVRDRVQGDARDRLVAEIMVDIRPGRRVARWIEMNLEHVPCRRARRRCIRIVAGVRYEGVVRVSRIDCDPAHEPLRLCRRVDAVKRDVRVRFIGI